MTIEESIRMAIEGGYNGYQKPFCGECGGYESPNEGCSSMFLDPLFWQSLGKAMGWHKDGEAKPGLNRFHFEGRYHGDEWRTLNRFHFEGRYHGDEWITKWHRFIDTLAEGKQPEDYFKTL